MPGAWSFFSSQTNFFTSHSFSNQKLGIVDIENDCCNLKSLIA